MKNLNVMSFFVLVFGVAAQANQGVTNDLPSVVLTCQETVGGAAATDAKEIALSRDQFGQTYLTVIQPSALQPLIENLPLTQQTCQGFVPCELYEADQGSTMLFLNYLADSTPTEGQLESPRTGSFSFICKGAL